jgi:hypothetical protein
VPDRNRPPSQFIIPRFGIIRAVRTDERAVSLRGSPQAEYRLITTVLGRHGAPRRRRCHAESERRVEVTAVAPDDASIARLPRTMVPTQNDALGLNRRRLKQPGLTPTRSGAPTTWLSPVAQ